MTYARRMIRQRPSLARQQTREAEERFSIHPESRNRLESTSHCNQTHENICNPFSRANFPLRPGPPVKNPRAPLVERWNRDGRIIAAKKLSPSLAKSGFSGKCSRMRVNGIEKSRFYIRSTNIFVIERFLSVSNLISWIRFVSGRTCPRNQKSLVGFEIINSTVRVWIYWRTEEV